MESSEPIKDRLKIFIWSITWHPIENFFKAKVRIADFFLAIWFISLMAFILNHFSLLPIGLKFLSNIYLCIGLFVLYLIFLLISKWRNREDIALWRKAKGIPNQTEIKRMKNETTQNNTERNIQTNP